jgi:hypothetical protein
VPDVLPQDLGSYEPKAKKKIDGPLWLLNDNHDSYKGGHDGHKAPKGDKEREPPLDGQNVCKRNKHSE